MQSFYSYKEPCKNTIKNKTCFKSMEGSYLDLILTNIYTIFKSTYTKPESKVLHKWQYKNFSKESFLRDSKFGLSNGGIVNFVGTQNLISLKSCERK